MDSDSDSEEDCTPANLLSLKKSAVHSQFDFSQRGQGCSTQQCSQRGRHLSVQPGGKINRHDQRAVGFPSSVGSSQSHNANRTFKAHWQSRSQDIPWQSKTQRRDTCRSPDGQTDSSGEPQSPDEPVMLSLCTKKAKPSTDTRKSPAPSSMSIHGPVINLDTSGVETISETDCSLDDETQEEPDCEPKPKTSASLTLGRSISKNSEKPASGTPVPKTSAVPVPNTAHNVVNWDSQDEDVNLPEVAFVSKRQQQAKTQTTSSGYVAKTSRKRKYGKHTTLKPGQGKLHRPEADSLRLVNMSYSHESSSSDTAIERVSSDCDSEPNSKIVMEHSDTMLISSSLVKSHPLTVKQQPFLHLAERNPREAFDNRYVPQNNEHVTALAEESNEEYLQMSPNILMQDRPVQVDNRISRSDTDRLDFVQISEVKSIAPNQFHSQPGQIVKTDADVGQAPGHSHVRMSEPSTVEFALSSRLSSLDSDLTQPYELSGEENLTAPPTLESIPSIPSVVKEQSLPPPQLAPPTLESIPSVPAMLNEQSLPPPQLIRRSSSIVPDSASSIVDSSTWPALTASALLTVKTECDTWGDNITTSVMPGSRQAEDSPVYQIKQERLLPHERQFSRGGLSVSVPFPDPTSLQDPDRGGNPATESLTISVSLPRNQEGQVIPFSQLKREAGENIDLKAGFHVGLSLLKKEAKDFSLKLNATKSADSDAPPADEDEADSDNSQCLFEDLPVQGIQGSVKQEAEVYMSDAEEEGHNFANNYSSTGPPLSHQLPFILKKEPISKDEMYESDSKANGGFLSSTASAKSGMAVAENVGYTLDLDDDHVVIFDSDEEEMFTSFTQVEVKNEVNSEDEEENLWSQDISDQQFLEISDDDSNDEVDPDRRNKQTSVLGSDIGSEDDDEITLDLSDDDFGCMADDGIGGPAVSASTHEEDIATHNLGHHQHQNKILPSVFSQPTLEVNNADEFSDADDVYLHDTQIDDDLCRDVDKSGKLAPQRSGLSVIDGKDSPADNFDDDMDETLLEAATEIEQNSASTEDYLQRIKEGMQDGPKFKADQPAENSICSTDTVGATERASLEKNSSSTATIHKRQTSDSIISLRSQPESKSSDFLVPNSEIVDLTVSSSDEEDGKGSGASILNSLCDGSTLADQENFHDFDSDSSSHSFTIARDGQESPKNKRLYEAETFVDVEKVSDAQDEDEDIDVYSVPTQRDFDPYLVATQIIDYQSPLSDSDGQSEVDFEKEGGEMSKSGGDIKTCAKEAAHSKPESREKEEHHKMLSSDSDSDFDPYLVATQVIDYQSPVSDSEVDVTGQSEAARSKPERGEKEEHHKILSSDSDSNSESNLGVGQEERPEEAFSDKESSRPVETRTTSDQSSDALSLLENAQKLMLKINEKSHIPRTLQTEPLPQIRRRGKPVGLKQKLCQKKAPEQVHQNDSNASHFTHLSSAQACMISRSASADEPSAKIRILESESAWLSKKPAPVTARASTKASSKPQQSHKRPKPPSTPDVSLEARQGRQQMEARRRKAMLHPELTSARKHRENMQPANPDLNTDVLPPNTQEMIQLGLPIMDNPRLVLKERLKERKTAEPLFSSVSESRHLASSSSSSRPQSEKSVSTNLLETEQLKSSAPEPAHSLSNNKERRKQGEEVRRSDVEGECGKAKAGQTHERPSSNSEFISDAGSSRKKLRRNDDYNSKASKKDKSGHQGKESTSSRRQHAPAEKLQSSEKSRKVSSKSESGQNYKHKPRDEKSSQNGSRCDKDNHTRSSSIESTASSFATSASDSIISKAHESPHPFSTSRPSSGERLNIFDSISGIFSKTFHNNLLLPQRNEQQHSEESAADAGQVVKLKPDGNALASTAESNDQNCVSHRKRHHSSPSESSIKKRADSDRSGHRRKELHDGAQSDSCDTKGLKVSKFGDLAPSTSTRPPNKGHCRSVEGERGPNHAGVSVHRHPGPGKTNAQHDNQHKESHQKGEDRQQPKKSEPQKEDRKYKDSDSRKDMKNKVSQHDRKHREGELRKEERKHKDIVHKKEEKLQKETECRKERKHTDEKEDRKHTGGKEDRKQQEREHAKEDRKHRDSEHTKDKTRKDNENRKEDYKKEDRKHKDNEHVKEDRKHRASECTKDKTGKDSEHRKEGRKHRASEHEKDKTKKDSEYRKEDRTHKDGEQVKEDRKHKDGERVKEDKKLSEHRKEGKTYKDSVHVKEGRKHRGNENTKDRTRKDSEYRKEDNRKEDRKYKDSEHVKEDRKHSVHTKDRTGKNREYNRQENKESEHSKDRKQTDSEYRNHGENRRNEDKKHKESEHARDRKHHDDEHRKHRKEDKDGMERSASLKNQSQDSSANSVDTEAVNRRKKNLHLDHTKFNNTLNKVKDNVASLAAQPSRSSSELKMFTETAAHLARPIAREFSGCQNTTSTESLAKVVARIRPPTPPRIRPPTPPKASASTGAGGCDGEDAKENCSLASRQALDHARTAGSSDTSGIGDKKKTVRFNPDIHCKYFTPLKSAPAGPSCPGVLAPKQVHPQLAEIQKFNFKPLVDSNNGEYATSSGKVRKLLDPDDLLMHLLRWQSLWLAEYEKKLTEASENSRSTPLPPPVVDFDSLYPLISTYGNNIIEYQQICFNLLLLETWEDVFSSWKKKRHQTPWYVFHSGTTRTRGQQMFISLDWTGLLTEQEYQSWHFPMESDLVEVNMVGFKLPGNNHQPSGSVGMGREVKTTHLGYVERVNIFKCTNLRELLYKQPQLKEHPAVLAKNQNVYVLKVTLKTHYRKFAPSNKCLITIGAVGSLTPAQRRFAALQMFPRCPLRDDVLDPSSSSTGHQMIIPASLMGRTQLNEGQSLVVRTALSAVMNQPASSPRICLLQGPPGTGKSHVIVDFILRVLKGDPKAKICLATPSNAAADELMKRLYKKKITEKSDLDMVRIGKVGNVHDEIKQFAFDVRLQNAKDRVLQRKRLGSVPETIRTEYERLERKLEQMTEKIRMLRRQQNKAQVDLLMREMKKEQKTKEMLTRQMNQGQQNMALTAPEMAQIYSEQLKAPQIVIGTLSSFGQPRIISTLCCNTADRRRNNNHFTCAIIDEATQATELDSLIPLQYGTTKLFLVGDPKQLPPTVLSTKAQSLSYNMSLFERLYNCFRDNEANSSVMMLDTQYRMDPSICHFPNQHIYEGRLSTDLNVVENCQRFPLNPYIVFDVAESQEILSQSGTLSNEMEADCTAILCQEFMNSRLGFSTHHIGIICPYAGQKQLVSKKLRDRGLGNIEVNTVDGFQGREKQIIILSCVRARSSTGSIGFVADTRRMNVALTRAKYALYIIGHLQSLMADNDWKSLIQDARSRRVGSMVHEVLSLDKFPSIVRQVCFKRSNAWQQKAVQVPNPKCLPAT